MKSPVSDAAAPTRFYFSVVRVRQLMAGMLAACTGPDLSYLAAVVARLQNARGGYRVGLVLCSPYSYCLSNTDSDDVCTPFADLE